MTSVAYTASSRGPERIRTSSLLFSIILFVFLAFVTHPAHTASLMYDQATGTLGPIDVSKIETGNNIKEDTYHDKAKEFYANNQPGVFIGRLLYNGDPTTLTFTNVGPDATNGAGNNFYWTNVNSTDNWTEFFIVIRAKGLRHNGSTHDFSGKNKVISYSKGYTYTLLYGAGTEEVAIGQTGYNAAGASGVYNGSNGFKYKYPYSVIWLDTIIVHIDKKGTKKQYTLWPPFYTLVLDDGSYETQLQISTNTGASYYLLLQGKNSSTSDIPMGYFFTVDKLYNTVIPYTNIEGRNTPATGLDIANVLYISEISPAKIKIASNAQGTEQNFVFTSNGSTYPYKLAFAATVPTIGATQVANGNTFSTTWTSTIQSPLGDPPHNANQLYGTIKLYVDGNTNPPMPGSYSSTIYVLVQPQ